jgi:antitoxin YefM
MHDCQDHKENVIIALRRQIFTKFCTFFSTEPLIPVSLIKAESSMKTATVSEFRAKMKEHLELVEKDQDVLVLSGPKKKDFVLITLEQYNSMEETAHLLSTPANAEKLMESIAQDKAGLVAHSFNIKASETKAAGKREKVIKSKAKPLQPEDKTQQESAKRNSRAGTPSMPSRKKIRSK